MVEGRRRTPRSDCSRRGTLKQVGSRPDTSRRNGRNETYIFSAGAPALLCYLASAGVSILLGSCATCFPFAAPNNLFRTHFRSFEAITLLANQWLHALDFVFH